MQLLDDEGSALLPWFGHEFEVDAVVDDSDRHDRVFCSIVDDRELHALHIYAIGVGTSSCQHTVPMRDVPSFLPSRLCRFRQSRKGSQSGGAGWLMCRAINQGLIPDLTRPEGESDFYFVQAEDPETALRRIVELVKIRIPKASADSQPAD